MESPSKIHPKVLAVLIICGALVATTFVYAEKNTLFGTSVSSQNIVSVDNSSSVTDQTNPLAALETQNATGTVTVVDPNILAAVGPSGATSSASTLTARVAQELFARFTADEQNGATIDDTEASNIADQTIADNAPASEAKQYTTSDIQIGTDTSKPARIAYGNAMVAVLTKNETSKTSVLGIMNTIVTDSQTNTDSPATDNANLNQLNPIITSYHNIIAGILKIPVPQDNVGIHIVYLNTLSDILYDIQNMQQTFTDPVMAYVGLGNYQTDSVKLQTLSDQMAVYLNQ
jgi:hypothetical protein